MAGQARKTYALLSPGLWRLRVDIAGLLEADVVAWPFVFPSRLDGFVGWGRRPSGIRAMRLATRFGKEVITLEDGFLRGFAPGQGEPSHSYVIDRDGIYFDAQAANGLERLLSLPVTDAAALERARLLIARLRHERLSKYNNSPLLSPADAGVPSGRPFVLLVDQVAGDASIAGAGAGPESFRAMLERAIADNPGKTIVVRTHPAAGDRSLLRQAAATIGADIAVPGRMNPWPLLEAADSVYTVSSQLGFEALMAGGQVHCFGTTYYSGRGLTNDYSVQPANRSPASLEQVFHAAFLDYSHYLDLHSREACSLERAVDQAIAVRDQRMRVDRKVFTAGFSPWKRRAMTPFLKGVAGDPVHKRSLDAAVAAAQAEDGVVAIWGSDRTLPVGVPAIRLEDGFIRSRGLGVALTMPSSIAMDDEHVYYDSRGESRLEAILSGGTFDEPLRARARALVHLLVQRGVSKYNLGTEASLPAGTAGQLKILVPGQVEKDASIRYGSPAVRSNAALVAAVRALFPDAFIVYKAHPDVVSGVRDGGVVPIAADMIVKSGDILQWIGWADRIETMTSLAGFEALLRGKIVGVHGAPFYAGWGLTDDRLMIPRRTRRIDLDTLVAASLIFYPFYVHPLSGLPCRPEDLIEEISVGALKKSGLLQKVTLGAAQQINRVGVLLRDSRLR
ncbi:capsular polysaccharide biosynthesis protein [Sinorhizobium sp. RAC02]|uniref:capsular polysaccharide biosynthesis protein n=1 Tax=Sinorhizobium sp. RAC02 TaxID=1842534 RepID=UPI00083E655F|nr:capsular polysaccharide biosynthesis protein [Sinorhizobium sp. RAC02]AOF89966.1 capsule polysaccharide biosynthesis family protein [Sinorhizobium sp. RAC02]